MLGENQKITNDTPFEFDPNFLDRKTEKVSTVDKDTGMTINTYKYKSYIEV